MNPTERIKAQLQSRPALLYMKGTPQFPQCGFSAKVSQILKNHGVSYGFVNILENPDIRATLPGFANWPTFPQFYIKGELVGGCDIICEMDASGELLELLQQAELIHGASASIVDAA